MRIALHGRHFSEDTKPYIKQIFDTLEQYKVNVIISDQLKSKNSNLGIDLDDFPVFNDSPSLGDVDYLFSMGGDGTLLEALTYIRRQQTPILGINTGRLGFLATIAKSNIKDALDSFFSGKYWLDERTLLHVDSAPGLYEDVNFALNEFAIMKKDTSSMITVKCYIDGEFLNTYWGDGLMVSTPTGSTGYSLSCGGPVVLPQSNNFIITPVSPHNLNVRPMVVSDSSVISFKIESRGINFLTSLDSRSYTVDNTVQLAVRKENFKAKLIKLEGYTFLDTLRNKLNWGYDIRN